MDPYRPPYPPYQGQPPQRHPGSTPPGAPFGTPPPHIQGPRPPHMYQSAPPPHLHQQQPYPPQGPPHIQGPPPHFQARGPPGQHFASPQRPPGPGAVTGPPLYGAPPQSAPPGLASLPPGYPVHPLPPQHHQHHQHHRGPRPVYGGSGSLPPPGSAPAVPGASTGFINGPTSTPGSTTFKSPKGVHSPGMAGIPASSFIPGGALPDKLNTLFIGSIAPGINNVAMEKLLKTTGSLVKWKRVQDPTTHQWKAFGFAEYADADSLLRTLRVLGQDGQQPKGEKPVGLELTAMDGSGVVKALLVKADEKTRQFLDQYEEGRPRTIHDTEKDKVALAAATKIIQQMKDGTLDTSEPEQGADDKEKEGKTTGENTPTKTEDNDQKGTAVEVSEEQQKIIDRELNFFRERAALKDKEEKQEQQRHRTTGRERAWGPTNSSGTKLSEFVPASGPNHIEVGSSSANAAGTTTAGAGARAEAGAGIRTDPVRDQDGDVDSEEEERARQERREQELEQLYRERERRWEQREVERMRLYEKDKARDEDYSAEQQTAKAAMAHRFAQWNDDEERERRHEDYYRDRSRWWQRRQAFLQKEERYDALDREEEKEELEKAAAKKAQEEEAAAESITKPATTLEEIPKVDHDGDTEMNENSDDVDTAKKSSITSPIPTEAQARTPDSANANILPLQSTKLKLSLSTTISALKRGSESNSGVSTPTSSSFVAATEFEPDEDDVKEVKKRRILVPFKYSDDESDAADKIRSSSSGNGKELSPEEKEKKEKEMKALIQSIPADAQGLWNWPIQWQYAFQDRGAILTDKIHPFASKKVVELLGVQEDELTNFIMEHIRTKKPPQELVSELRNALDDDADVLVMKIWRMLIFETESKARQL
ncbi:hypothetical protein BCR41DRAFT_419701 [Lobosporangium transversale]|uniref:PWI domain-containing protein n=1 Tax=Lobosporangium transversale TaxID=64571 RepID=A0A1Y2GWP8_9FUNG|nr:hypothetical protein BCR41DRAFT_419701 [Lobosporangium transversale]ORZ26726.1 hypothetical protein BCR41DRAFT_419701 [Lobosporangium transversale]|eukprot:XP_021884489.1 hypothetical protein BCR41DRAFT_419701 [Lobosporangium transversale]